MAPEDDAPDDAAAGLADGGAPRPDELEAGRWLFTGPCRFFAAADSTQRLPVMRRPEVAFAGRSNVGKSSLVNALTGRNGLARTSNTPGRTQQIIFFDLADRLTLVDLPGHGFARAPRELVRRWTELVRAFLRGRPSLHRVCLLVDARHGLKANDREMMQLMDEAAVNYQAVLTKCDKIRPGAVTEMRDHVAHELKRHPAAHPTVLTTSAAKGDGIAELRAALAMLADPGETGGDEA